MKLLHQDPLAILLIAASSCPYPHGSELPNPQRMKPAQVYRFSIFSRVFINDRIVCGTPDFNKTSQEFDTEPQSICSTVIF